ncbi:cytidylyltransferase domain-containing protein [Halochromatium roseum]|uniref:acylneuraminate cytidylyltransferase family protein n=1 Tax=Halochromatium roseum TaxID=391920 RepID=UPI00237A36BF|nr:acylneuraminate cytidylyltransferase family protein [Halochromatium roseum]
MNCFALIPARGGSKGIPRKNVRLLADKPLIAWTIESALQAISVERVVVSTEDEEIASIAEAYGADIPFMRPRALAGDDTPTMDVVYHALDQLCEYDWVLLLQPTSPLRTAEDIDGMAAFCEQAQAPAAVSICPCSKHPFWSYWQAPNGLLRPYVTDQPLIARRQDCPPAFELNGAMYLGKASWLRQQSHFVTSETVGYRMPRSRSLDLDTPDDWLLAEFLIGRQRSEEDFDHRS